MDPWAPWTTLWGHPNKFTSETYQETEAEKVDQLTGGIKCYREEAEQGQFKSMFVQLRLL